MAALTPQPNHARRRPSGFAAALLAVVWYAISQEIAARAATGLVGRAGGGLLVPLLRPVFLIFLLLLAFLLLDAVKRRTASVRELLALPSRPTARQEWGIGLALGWGAAFVAVLPLTLTGGLLLQLWTAPRAWLLALIAIGGAALSTLGTELVFRGYAYRRCAESVGPAWAAVLLSAVYALFVGLSSGRLTVVLVALLLGLLLTNGWLRTHALWLPWGLHFGWNIALGLLFGLPVLDSGDLSSIVQAQLTGRSGLSGAGLGPIAAPWTLLVLLGLWVVLFRVTRTLSWNYTHPVLVPGGYATEVPPSAAHQAMERSAPPPPLVQILPTTPTERSQDKP